MKRMIVGCLFVAILLTGCQSYPYMISAFPNCKRVSKGDIVHKDGFWVAPYEFYRLARKASE